MYVLISNGIVRKYPYGVEELRKDNPTTSFPNNIDVDTLADWNVLSVTPQNPPAFNHALQSCGRINPTLVSGKWVETWAVSDIGVAQQEQRNIEKSAEVRAGRNNKLNASDWTQVADAPVDQAAWATYRQDLRDVTAQAGFPWTITWPDVP